LRKNDGPNTCVKMADPLCKFGEIRNEVKLDGTNVEVEHCSVCFEFFTLSYIGIYDTRQTVCHPNIPMCKDYGVVEIEGRSHVLC